MEVLLDESRFVSALATPIEKSRKRRHSLNDFSDDDASSPKSQSPSVDDDRRAHHNELERRRRDHIKDHFMALKDAIPLLEGEKSSRALILKRAIEYISMMKTKLRDNQSGIAELKRRNELLEAQLTERQQAVPVVPRYQPLPCSSAATVPMIGTLPQPMPITTAFKPTVSIPTPIASCGPLPSMDALRLSGVLPPSQENILAITQMLLNQAKLNQKEQELHNRVMREQQMAHY